MANESSSYERLGLHEYQICFSSKHCNLGSSSTHWKRWRVGDERAPSQVIMGWWWKHPGMLRLRKVVLNQILPYQRSSEMKQKVRWASHSAFSLQLWKVSTPNLKNAGEIAYQSQGTRKVLNFPVLWFLETKSYTLSLKTNPKKKPLSEYTSSACLSFFTVIENIYLAAAS